MIDLIATMTKFGYVGDGGGTQKVVAVCPSCDTSRITQKRYANKLCRLCAAKHQKTQHRYITIKPATIRGLPI